MSLKSLSSTSTLSRRPEFSSALPGPSKESASSPTTGIDTTDSFTPSPGLSSESEQWPSSSMAELAGWARASKQTTQTATPELRADYPIQRLADGRCVGVAGSGFGAHPVLVPCPQS